MTPTIPPTPAEMNRRRHRLRIQQALRLSVAGPVGAYQYHGRSADVALYIFQLSASSPACVTRFPRCHVKTTASHLRNCCNCAQCPEREKMSGRSKTVTGTVSQIVNYQINATLYLYPGPESEPIRAAPRQSRKPISAAPPRARYP